MLSGGAKLVCLDLDKKFHILSNDSIEYVMESCLTAYKVKVRSNIKTKVRLYTIVKNKLYWLYDIYGDQAYAKLTPCTVKTFVISEKVLAIATDKPCFIEYKVRKLDISILDSKLNKFILESGHLVIFKCVHRKDKLIKQKHFDHHSLTRYLADRSLEDAKDFKLTNIEYCINLASALSVTDNVENIHRYSPFSARLTQSKNYIAVLTYNIYTKPSAGDDAEITVTCIESISKNSYALLQGADGKPISAQITGTRLQGKFDLPIGCIDVGLHIYTPYGFSGDIGDDPNTDLIIFNLFKISYKAI